MNLKKVNKKVLIIVLALIIFVYYFIATDKFSHPISPDFSFIPECSSLPDFNERKEVFCQIDYQTVFELARHQTLNEEKCEKAGVRMGWGGCYLENVIYDKKYIQELKEKKTDENNCWTTTIYKYKGIKKGYTEIITTGSCHFDKKYKIFVR